MKKGFTLVELLAVIVILGVTIAIVAVKIDSSIKNSNNFINERQVELIENAANLYVEEYSNEITNFSTLNVGKVTLGTLINKGLIKEKDVKDISTSNVVMIAKVNGSIKTKYTETEKNVIFLVGTDKVTTTLGSTYTDLGAYALVVNTGLVELTSSNMTSTVNVNTAGTYKVTYSYTNASNVERIVTVK